VYDTDVPVATPAPTPKSVMVMGSHPLKKSSADIGTKDSERNLQCAIWPVAMSNNRTRCR
jgi:hypothetical protein